MITIIVLLILAGVSIATLTGDNGILGQASKAKTESTIGKEKEQIGLAFNAVKMKKISEKDNSDITAAELEEELNYNGITDAEVTGTGTLIIEFIDSKNIYTIDKNGKITEGEIEIGIVVTPETEGIISYTDKNGNAKEFTEEVEDGDIIIYGDYEYRYNEHYSAIWDDTDSKYYYNWYSDAGQNGWGVLVIDSQKTRYSELCSVILGKEVKSLERTFTDCIDLTESPKIPNTVVNLKETFWNCLALKEAPQVPNSVTNMDSTFYDCLALTTISISKSLTTLNNTFNGCASLTKVYIPSNIKVLSNTFYGCRNLVDVEIPESIEEIGKYSFADCEKLNNIILSDNVKVIGRNAFYRCKIFTSFTIPDTIKTIEAYTFRDCISLLDITIPNSIENIEYEVFDGCTNLETIIYNGTTEEWGNITLGNGWARNVKATTVQCTDGSVNI